MNYVKGYTPRWLLSWAILLLSAGSLQAQGVARLVVTPDTVLLDERFDITLSGVAPAQEVTIRVDGNRGTWRSSGTFRSDAQGRVAVADPMKLIWSATGTPRPGGAQGSGVQPWVVTAEFEGRVVATDTLWRRVLAPAVRVVRVNERGLVGTAYFPPGSERRPAMIVLGGSVGGIPAPGAYSSGLASRGYVVLGLAYFNAEGLAPQLRNFPLEYFDTAIAWLKAQPTVDPARIGVLGGSRGGELALLLGSIYPAFRVVVASVPSNVVWPGMGDDSETPAWTLNGKPFNQVPGHFIPSDSLLPGRDRFLRRMQSREAVARAEIQVERINGPVLLFSALDDQVWPSDIFALRVVERLKARGFKHPVEHYAYENAGHFITRPYVPTTTAGVRQVHPVSGRWNVSGGTPEGQARAHEDSWKRLLTFLERYLRN